MTDEETFPAFHLVRDPTLRRPDDDRRAQILDETIGRERARLAALHVLVDLSSRQQKELTALVLDISEVYTLYRSGRPWLDRLKAISKRRPRHVRTLRSKIAAARKALEEIRCDARRLDVWFTERVDPLVERAQGLLDEMELIGRRGGSAGYASAMANPHQLRRDPHSIDPDPEAREQLFGYLRETCGLLFRDACVRTGKIGNALWEWNLSIGRNEYGEEDCPAIRIAIGRRSSRQASA